MAASNPPPADGPGASRGNSTTAAAGAVGTAAAFMPHVLHRAGLIAGAAFLSGLVGGIVFAILGLVAIVPITLRIHRRAGTWRAPIAAVVAFG
jgi:hypothetical protein